MIENVGKTIRLTCEQCPAAIENDGVDLRALVDEARRAGWRIEKRLDVKRDAATADLFGRPAGTDEPATRAQPYAHTCPACRRAVSTEGLL